MPWAKEHLQYFVSSDSSALVPCCRRLLSITEITKHPNTTNRTPTAIAIGISILRDCCDSDTADRVVDVVDDVDGVDECDGVLVPAGGVSLAVVLADAGDVGWEGVDVLVCAMLGPITYPPKTNFEESRC